MKQSRQKPEEPKAGQGARATSESELRSSMFPIVKALELPNGLMEVVEKAHFGDSSSSQGFTGDGRGGIWSSSKDLLQRFQAKSPALDTLAKAVLAAAVEQKEGDYVLSAWANSIKSGQSVAIHDHVATNEGPNSWAAIYYVRSPGGTIVFGGKSFEPKTGELYFFPADLAHEVPPFAAAQSRISIVFNVRAAAPASGL